MSTALALTDAQARVLRTMLGVGRAVGARATDEVAGYVHSATAKALVRHGLLDHEIGATGRDVFTITDAGRDALGLADSIEG